MYITSSPYQNQFLIIDDFDKAIPINSSIYLASGAVGGLTDEPNAEICHQIKITWNSPTSPNGIILYYQVTVQVSETRLIKQNVMYVNFS